MNNNLCTPCFVLNKQGLDDSINRLNYAISSYWPNTIIGYSYKTNSLLWLVSYLKSKSIYAEVVSDDELSLARHIGYDYNQIVFNGPKKSKQKFIEAVNSDSIVNIDSYNELEYLSEVKSGAKVGVRVNFSTEDYIPDEVQDNVNGGRFGFSYENGDLELVLKKINFLGIKVSGLHLHISSKTRSINVYSTILKNFVCLVEEMNLNLEYVDIGGGFFSGVPGKPDFCDYFKTINEILNSSEKTKGLKLIIEPGISLIGSNIDYYTRVNFVRKNTKTSFVFVDGSRTHVDPLFHRSSYLYEVISDNEVIEEKNLICGYTCMENDKLFEINQKLSQGDIIVLKKVGAYSITFGSNFIEFMPKCYLNDNGSLSLIRDKWNVFDIISKQVIYKE